MARRRYNLLADIFLSPWWLSAVIGVFLVLFSKYVKEIKTGLLPIGPIFSPLITIVGIALLCIAGLLLLKTIVQSLFFNGLRKRGYPFSKAGRISLVWDIVGYVFELCKQKWPVSPAGSVRAGAWRGESPHSAAGSFTHQPGTATIIGESGAWIDIAEEIQRQGLNVRKIEDIEPLLAELRKTSPPWLASFHEGIARCVHFKNNQIAALRAEPGFFTAIINWFLILWREQEIVKLHEEEKRYAERLSENIRTLESLQQSPELAGAKAELEVIDQLRSLPGEYTVFSNIRLRASRAIRFDDGWLKSAQLDHVVLSPAGVFVIETKRWSKKFVETGEYHSPFAQVRRAGYLCYDLLRRAFGKTPVRNIIVSDGSLPPAPADSHVKVLHLAELNGYITWFNRGEQPPDRLLDIRNYLERYITPFHPAADLHNGDPAEILNSGFPGKILREADREGLKSAAPRKSRAVLIPTEPPPSKTHDELKYMSPSMRKEFEDKHKIQGALNADHKYTHGTIGKQASDLSAAAVEYSIASVARTVTRVCGAPEQGLEDGAAAADMRVTAHAPAAGVKKLLIYTPDAIGRLAIVKFPVTFSGLENAGFLRFPVQSVYPSKTPGCYASMFTGLTPDGHGVKQEATPVISCKTVFDVLPAHGVRTAIVAVKDSSVDLLFRGRKLDYFSEKYDQEVADRALGLIEAGNHDCILVHQQGYDNILHGSDPWNNFAQEAIKRHMLAFEALAAAFDKKWPSLQRAILFAPEHGAHTDPRTGKGTHGDNISADMEVTHYWKFQA